MTCEYKFTLTKTNCLAKPGRIKKKKTSFDAEVFEERHSLIVMAVEKSIEDPPRLCKADVEFHQNQIGGRMRPFAVKRARLNLCLSAYGNKIDHEERSFFPHSQKCDFCFKSEFPRCGIESVVSSWRAFFTSFRCRSI